MARKPACVKKAAKRSRYNEATLLKVFKRGYGAAKTNPQSVRSRFNPKRRNVPASQRFSPTAWGCARVNAFVAGRRKVDPDLRRRRRR